MSRRWNHWPEELRFLTRLVLLVALALLAIVAAYSWTPVADLPDEASGVLGIVLGVVCLVGAWAWEARS